MKELKAVPPSSTIFAFPEEGAIAGRPRKFEVFRDGKLSEVERKHNTRVQIMLNLYLHMKECVYGYWTKNCVTLPTKNVN